MSSAVTSAVSSSIVVHVKPAWTAFAFMGFPLLFRPVLSVDGERVGRVLWYRSATVPVTPGRHTVELTAPRMALAGVVVDVAAGETAVLHYRSPFTSLDNGRVVVQSGTEVFDDDDVDDV